MIACPQTSHDVAPPRPPPTLISSRPIPPPPNRICIVPIFHRKRLTRHHKVRDSDIRTKKQERKEHNQSKRWQQNTEIKDMSVHGLSRFLRMLGLDNDSCGGDGGGSAVLPPGTTTLVIDGDGLVHHPYWLAYLRHRQDVLLPPSLPPLFEQG